MAIGKAPKHNRSDHNEATPYGHSGKVEKSGRSHWDGALAGGRAEMATPYGYAKPVPRSSKEDLGNPRTGKGQRNRTDFGHGKGKHSPPYGGDVAPGVPKSGYEGHGNPKEPTKWHRRGYNMTVPATLAEGSPIAAKMKRLK